MNLAGGLDTIEQILRNLNRNQGLNFDSYQLKKDVWSNSYKLIIWKGREFLAPIQINIARIVDSNKSPHGYMEMEKFLKNELKQRMNSTE